MLGRASLAKFYGLWIDFCQFAAHLSGMKHERPDMIDVTPTEDFTPLDAEALAEIAALAARQKSANGVLMKTVNYVGGQVESGLKALPDGARTQIDKAARLALEKSFQLAARTRTGPIGRTVGSDRLHKILGTVSGAIGGVAGIGTALTELPFATTIIFRAVQAVAEEHGEDPQSAETRMECLAVFGAGGPGSADDGVDTSFIGARLSLTGTALHRLIATVAPRFATMMTQKLASQSVPVLGAIAGAGTNYAFVDYYIQMAHVHFGLRALFRKHGEAAVADAFHAALAASDVPVNKA